LLKNIYPKVTYILLLLLTVLCSTINVHAQNKVAFTSTTQNAFFTADAFIENIGQYGNTYKGQEQMGNILFGFEGHSMPILFTKTGLIILQRKVEKISKREEEKLEKQGLSEEEIEHKKTVTDRAITMEWVGANTNVQIIQEEKTTAYHTYGLLTTKAYGYKKITYKNLYNGIDLVYHFAPNKKIGFEYSLHVAAGADISQIKMQYGGDVKKIKTNKAGNLLINSDIEGVEQSVPVSFYSNTTNKGQFAVGNMQLANSIVQSAVSNKEITTQQNNKQQTPNNKNKPTNQLITIYTITNNKITFSLPLGYDNTKPIIIDPFVSSTSNLNGTNAGRAKDIDFDYAGNMYVIGGGNAINHRLAKYNSNGVLQWTFNGVLTNPVWQFGNAYGGWVVEKITGKTFLGQGGTIEPTALIPFRIVRIGNDGLYDNYITTASANFEENWRMIWNCNNGNQQLLIGGGSTNSNINFGLVLPPNTNLSTINITSLSGEYQDIVDCIIDPINNKMYSIFASSNVGLVNNEIFCHSFPFSTSSILWSKQSGYNSLVEAKNRPYLSAFGGSTANENSANIFSLNPTYLFYWDGKYLKAFNKSTGADVGTPLITTNTKLLNGGIYADACNNVYVGSINGTIKVYNFNGNNFDDGPSDINITGYSTKSIYDIVYDDAEKLLYACGDGFVTAIDIAGNCGTSSTGFSVNITPICNSATATLTPAPATGSTITYALYNGNTLVTINNTGIFSGLIPNAAYKVKATINEFCSGIRLSQSFFTTSGSPAPLVSTPLTYCQGATATALTATGTGLLWYTTAIGGTGSAIAPIPSTAVVGSTTYYVSQTITTGNCAESPRASIVVNTVATPIAPTVINNINYCQAAVAPALTATGTNLRWYTVAIGGTSSTTAPVPSTAVVGSTTYYVSQSTAAAGGCESPRASITVQVIAIPATPSVITPIAYCQGVAASTLTAVGTNLLWYNTATGSTGSSTAPIPNTAVVANSTYYVSQSTSATGGCESPRASIVVNVSATAAAPIVTTPITYCQGTTATALTATGTNLLWYSTATGGTGSSTAPIPSTAAVGASNYYVSQSIAPGGCESQRASIAVQINITPLAPVVTSVVSYCQGATATALTATGTNLLWYTTAVGGTGSATAPIPTTTIIGSTTYYVSQKTAQGCESPRASIVVQVSSTLVAPIVTSPISYCQGAVALPLTATGSNLLWYNTATGGTGSSIAPVPNTAIVGSSTYYVSQSNTTSGCAESPRAAIVVNITALLNVNAGNTITIVQGANTQLNATATAGADYTWTSSIVPITLSNVKILNPIANPLQTTSYLLTVKDLIGTCPPVSSSVQVIVTNTKPCINIRNAFTPNGDGKNDFWFVYDNVNCLAQIGASVKVFNRYGSKVYENANYKNNWDGTYKSKPLPDGTYYAVVEFTFIDGIKIIRRADVSIVR
jgi:gliding motility-associated-like protein